MDINTLLPQLQEVAKTGSVSVKDVLPLFPVSTLLIESYPEARALQLAKVEVKYNEETKRVVLRGQTKWLEDLGIVLEFAHKKTKSGPRTRVKASLPAKHKLSIPGLTWFALEEAAISLATIPPRRPLAQLLPAFEHELNCTLVAGKIRIPLRARYIPSSNFVLQLDLEEFSFTGINQMLKIVGGEQAFALPSAFDKLGAIRLHQLEIEMAPGPKKVNTLARIGFGFGTAKAWELIPKIFTLESIEVYTQLYQPLKNTRNFGGFIRGKLKIGKTELSISANKLSRTSPWTFQTIIDKISLSDLAEKVLKEFSIEVDLPKINFADTKLSITPSEGNYQMETASSKDSIWKIPLGNKQLELKDIKLSLAREAGKTTGHLEGNAKLFGTTITAKADFNQQLEIELSLKNLSLKAIAHELLDGIDLPKELPDVAFDQVIFKINPKAKSFSLKASSTHDWTIPLGVTGLVIEDIHLDITRKKDPKTKKMQLSGSFGGQAKIGTVTTKLEYKFPGDFVFTTVLPDLSLSPIIQDLCGTQAMMGISLPDSIANISLSDITIEAAPKQKRFSISGSSPIGKAELIITKNKQGKWAFITGFSPSEHWKFSSLDRGLVPLDSLNLSNSALILSSANTRDLALKVIKVPSGVTINRGLTFMSALDLSELGVKDLMGIEMLLVSTTIDSNPANIRLEAKMAGRFKVTDSISMGNMSFFLKPAPSNFELGVKGSMLAKLGDSDLDFVGSMAIRPVDRSAAFAVTMLGIWKEPFGVKGLAMGNVALEVGIGIVPPPAVAAPIVGIAGDIQVGSFNGSAAVKFDTAMPSKSMIAASFNKLHLQEVMDTFCDKKVIKAIPKEIRNTVLAVGLEAVAVYVVPQPTTIGELSYDAGFKFQGKMTIADFQAEFFFLLSYQEGFAIKAKMDPIRIGKIFALEGMDKHPGPTLDVDLRLGGTPGVVIAGKASLLGLQAGVFVHISDKEFKFTAEGEIFDVFTASLTVSGTNFKQGGDFYVEAKMRNDLISHLRKEIRNGIKAAADGATKELEKAQAEVRKAQREVDKIQGSIEAMRKTIKKEREASSRGVKNAEREVKKAQDKVKELQGSIESMRKTIRKEREKSTRGLRAAQKKMKKAQDAVNSIQNEIRSSKRSIDGLNRDIKRKKKWYDNSGWKKSYRWAEYSGYVAAKNAEIGVIYAKIGTLEASKLTANGALEAAKAVVRGIEVTVDTFPIDADVRIAALFTAKGTAVGALEAAKQSLRLLEKTIDVFPIDADVRIAGLFTAKGTATAALQVAIGALEVSKKAVGGLAEVSDFIVKHGLGGLFDVKKADFKGQLNALSSGAVSLSLEMTLLKKPMDLSLDFNFKQVGKSVEKLTKKLIKELE